MAEASQISETGRTKATPQLYNALVRDAHRMLAANAASATIGAGAIAVSPSTASVITVSAESGTADDMDTINGGSAGDIILLQAASGHAISLTTAGNIAVATALPNSGWLALHYDGAVWRAVGGAGGGTPKLVKAGTLLVAGGWMSPADKSAYVSVHDAYPGFLTPQKMIDNDYAAFSTGIARQVQKWIAYDFGVKVALDGWRHTQHGSYADRSFTIWTSNTGAFAGEEVLVPVATTTQPNNGEDTVYEFTFQYPVVARYWKFIGYLSNATTLAYWSEHDFRFQATLLFSGVPWGGKVELLDGADAVLETQSYNSSVYQQVLLPCTTDAASVARIKIYYPSDLTTPVIDVTAAALGGVSNGDVLVIER